MAALGIVLSEIGDWTCCGASAAEPTSTLISLALPARNLALVEKAAEHREDIMVPCSACYLNLKRALAVTSGPPETLAMVNAVLAEEDLVLKGNVTIRHLLDVLARDLGSERIREAVNNPLEGLRIAPYYGCQAIRPFVEFDDPEVPRSMEPLIEACGATVHHWSMGGKCCGASHMNTKPEVGIALSGAILQAACGADAIVTVCPMCQMNLEAYQRKISKSFQADLSISILYLPQLIGMAMGLAQKDLGLHLNLAVTRSFYDKISLKKAVA
jgi:heterodisulfide reductase subunit B